MALTSRAPSCAPPTSKAATRLLTGGSAYRLDRFVAFDKGDFIGAEAVRRAREEPPAQLLVLLEVDATDADASADEGIWIGERRVGFVTSGAYGHHVGKSLALAYLDRDVAGSKEEVTVFVVGEPRTARVLPEPPYDPKGNRLRDISGG